MASLILAIAALSAVTLGFCLIMAGCWWIAGALANFAIRTLERLDRSVRSDFWGGA